MSSHEHNARDSRTVRNIRKVLAAHASLCRHAWRLEVAIESVRVVLRGTLPSQALQAELIPAVRSAGVLRQIDNRVRVDAVDAGMNRRQR